MAPKKNLKKKKRTARKSLNRRVSRAARLAILQEEPASMKTDADEFDQDAIECGIRLSLLEQQPSQQDNNKKKDDDNESSSEDGDPESSGPEDPASMKMDPYDEEAVERAIKLSLLEQKSSKKDEKKKKDKEDNKE
ncbi:Oidioi.mRNA.OKI2018_I69.chr1.g3135.t1.cds [Oikopleura dioica]|uniref:Oidioi.mRNA.OKI2018_I69.chr1.g3135.t1.cds n=1 Tax=Oikopleura dioica TaxID=34765 RepID=A0ABN7T025_OIKDI|nr:Oidioi.mRNA.OKI2018_I69.chr1.g3135.t1.cds [Oikopleura dioica]